MSKQSVLVEVPDMEAQLVWKASGDGIVGKSACRWCAYTGQQEEAVRDWGWIEALHPEDRERVRHLWLQAREQKRFYETWYRLRKHDGTYQTFLIQCMPIFNDDDTLGEWVSQFVPATAEHLLLKPDSLPINLLQHSFFEQASIGVVYVSLDGHYLHVNEHFCSLTGYSSKELIGRRVTDITLPEDDKISHAYHPQQLASSLSSYIFEKRYLCKNGEMIWTHVTSIILRLPSGEPLCFFGLVEDITERKRAEKEQKRLLDCERAAGEAARREKQEVTVLIDQLRAVFEAMTESVVCYDAKGRKLLQNAAFRRQFELDPENDMIGIPYQEVLPRYEIYDEHRRPVSIEQLPVSRILRGEVLSNEQAMDLIMHLPSGREVVVGMSGAPVNDRQGQMIGCVCVCRDITELRQKERRVRQTLDALLTIVEEVSRLPIQCDEAGEGVPVRPLYAIGQRLTEIIRQVLQCRFVACHLHEPQTGKLHPAGVSGLTTEEEHRYRQEIEQSFDSDYLDAEFLARLHANKVVIRDLMARPFVQPRTDFGAQYRMVAPMILEEQLVGTLVIAQTRADQISTPEEMALVKAIAKLIVQVIERARLTNQWMATRANELALGEANRRFDAFLSIASHELRTPLTTIKGKVQLALRRLEKLTSQFMPAFAGCDGYEQIIHDLERVHQPLVCAVHRTAVQDRMISDLLDASRIRANKLELVMQPCDLAEIVCETVGDLRSVAPDRVVRLHLPETRPVPMVADADRLGQVINNYLVNALRYAPAERPVEVWLEMIEGGTKARVAVRDQGSGIAPPDLEHIWERFYRSDGTETHCDTGAGLGLGLYISRSIIEQHNGQVGVESVQGKGSMFWFTLALRRSKETSVHAKGDSSSHVCQITP
ncbi:MAG TPA: PAS domain S-box protein [Ktedonobacteraceae bacterium]|nr:PAS domain S-box protein [Ktedonobacteraceae bacterium]